MQIESIQLFHLRLPETDSVLVQLTSGQQSGWGEACVRREPIDSSEWAGGAFACLRDFLAPAVRGQSILDGGQLQELVGRFQGNHAAKSALDCAWWDLRAQTHATTVAAMLGGNETTLTISHTIPVLPTIDELFAQIELHKDRTNTLLLKFRPGWDEQMLRAVRQVYPSAPLAIDCDGCCNLSQSELLYRLDDFMLKWIEQPLAADDLVAHAMLQEQLRTPICLHQSLTSRERVEQALDLGSCRAVKIDPTLAGGLTPALAMHEEAAATGIPLAVAGRYQTPAGKRAHEALATLGGFTLPTDLPETSQVVAGEISADLLDAAIDHASL